MYREFFRRNRPLVLTLIILLFVNLVVLFLFTLPQMDADAVSRKRIETAEEQHSELQRVLAERREFIGLLKDNSADLQKFYTEILGEREERITAILEEREDIGNQFGILPKQVRYGFSTQRDMPLETFSMSFPLTGTYESFRFFVHTLENSKSFFIIDDIELANQQDDPDAMNMRIAVSTLFYEPEPNLRQGEEIDE